MIDFKKEVQKYQPARTVEDLQDSLIVNEIKDINELLQHIAAMAKKNETQSKEL